MDRLSAELKRAERATRQFLPFFKFPIGKTDLRILPAPKGEDEDGWFVPVGFHYNLNEKQPIICRAETNWAHEDCAVCAAVTELRAAGQNDEAQRIGVRRQYIVRAIVRGQEEKGIQMLRLPTTVWQSIGKIVLEKETFGDVLSMSPKGRDIRVIKTGTGLATQYEVQALPQTKPALPTPGEVKAVMEKLDPIANLVSMPTSKEVEMLVKAKLGFVVSTPSVGAVATVDEADDEWNSPPSKEETDWDDAAEDKAADEGDDEDWGDEGGDVPFDDSESEEKEGAVEPVSDDSWLADDDDEDDGIDYGAKVQALRDEQKKKQATQMTGLTEGLSKELHKTHAAQEQEPERRKKGKSRQRLGA